jgi:hypothetical protein
MDPKLCGDKKKLWVRYKVWTAFVSLAIKWGDYDNDPYILIIALNRVAKKM